MRKLLLLAAFITLSIASSFAQNLQIHYDMGKDRKYITSTFEMFKPDDYGASFFFIDFDFNQSGNKSASLAYFEVARYLKLPFICDKLSATVQYNDGTAPWGRLGSIWLAGFSYPIDLGFVTLSTDLLARKDYASKDMDIQLTTVWYKPFFDNKLVFQGFLDVWSKHNPVKKEREFVVLTEPQLWYNVWDRLNLGGEVEISNNFIASDEFQVNPTLGIKWNF